MYKSYTSMFRRAMHAWCAAAILLIPFWFTGLTAVRATGLAFSSVGISGTNLVVSGSGGASNATYFVMASTNLALSPIATWNRISTNVFSANGQFTNSVQINPSVPQEFIVISTTIPVTIASGLTANDKGYDGTTVAMLSSNNVVLAGVSPADVGNVWLSTNGYAANFSSANAGTNITVAVSGLTLAGSAANNYALAQPSLAANISTAPVTVVSGLTASNKVYDGTTVATITSNNVVLAGVLPADVGNVWLSTNGYAANFSSANAGTNITVAVSGLTLAGSAANNYALAQPSLAANISTAPVTVVSGLTASNKVYDGTTVATITSNNVVLAGVLPADVGNVWLSTNGYAANFSSANAGTNITVAVGGLTLAGSAANNYALAQPSLAANISTAPVTVVSGLTASNKVYDGTTVATITSNNVVLAAVLPGDVGNVWLSTNGYAANFSSANAGNGIGVAVGGLTLAGSAANNYALAQPSGLSANITKVGVTITSGITANNKPYDGTTLATISSNAVVLGGVLAEDTANVSLSTNGYVANFASAAAGNGIGVTVSGLGLTGAASGNYSLTQPSGLSANITKVGVTITSGISASNKVYDGTTAATITSNNVVLAGVLPADAGNVWLSTNGYAANFSSANAGTNIPVTVSGLTLAGSAAGNYTLSQPTGLMANITALKTVLGLVAAYSFDEGSGTTVFDASGNGNNGTISGTTWTTAGKYGNALVFNGTNSMVIINNSPSLDLTTGMTLEAWVNPSVVSTVWRDVIYKGDDNYFLSGTSDKGPPAAGGTFYNGDVPLYAARNLTLNTWTFLAVTYNQSTLKIYTNGVLAVSASDTGSISNSANPLTIGGDPIYGQFFRGTIDEARVYNLALTAAQVQADMSTPVGNIPTAPGNLAATVLSSNQVNLSWTASTGDLGVAEYFVERAGPGGTNFTQIGASSGTNYQDGGLVPNTNYTYRVRAVDSVGDVGPYSSAVTVFTGLSVSPLAAVLTFTRTQQFMVNPTNAAVNWSVDGIAGGSGLVGTITAAGLYTPPGSVGTHIVNATTTDLTQTGTATVYVTGNPGVFTYHIDNFRTGENTNETVLTTANVNSTSFGKLAAYTLDGFTFSSPLYVANVNIPGQGFHNVVYAATEHDSVYAFDADGLTNTPLWHTNFTNPGAGITTIPLADIGNTGPDIPNEVGITSTPVINSNNGTIYVVAKTKEISGNTTTYVMRLHALDIATGAEKLGGPVVIPGLDPLRENQRTALLLANGVVYFAFSSHGDIPPWNGWVLGYNATNLQQVLAYNACPASNGEGGIWMNGDGPAADVSSNIYFITGNGVFDANTGGSNYGDSFVKINPAGTVLDYFTPFNQATQNSQDLDMCSGGVLLLPDQAGAHTHEMVSAGKDGTICLVDRNNMGHFNSSSNDIVQSLLYIFPNSLQTDGGNFSSPVYYKGYVYFGPVANTVQAFQLSNGLLSTNATSQTSEIYDGRGGTMAVSANGGTNGILWTLQCNDTGEPPPGPPAVPGTLHAYNAANLTNELYNSDQAGSRDTLGNWWKFTTPIVVNGKVFVSSGGQLTVYGLLPNPVGP